jgi:ATP-binding cassette subfamily C (CFTR/MRP) protein 1
LNAVQKRVGVTSSFLTNLKGLNMLGLVQHLADRIQGLRDVEIIRAKSYLKIDTLMNVCANSPTLLSPVITLLLFAFAPFGASSTHLTSSIAYYTLTVVGLMSSPLGLALNAIPSFFASLACFRRIQTYLELEERNDYRLLPDKKKISFFAPASTEIYPQVLPEVEGTEMKQWSEGTALGISSRTDKLVFSISDGWFGYTDKQAAILRDINLQCRTGSFTVVSGPVGCGKSTLLKALLGEVPYFSGTISVTESSIAYCAQVPWLQNLSLRDNILGGLPFDEKLYADVMLATCLNSDVVDLPEGDMTKLGSNGTNLSGGQGQRVAVARAIYMRHPLLLLDDCFSGLDSKTEGLVFERLFGLDGLIKRLKFTVVLVTHAKHHIREADTIIILTAHGRVASVGMANQPATSDEFVDQITSLGIENSGGIDSNCIEEQSNKLFTNKSTVRSTTAADFLED